MYLYLMHDELGRTGQIFDRARTLEQVDYIRQWFGNDIERGVDHSMLDALIDELRSRAEQAEEIGVVQGY